MSKSQVNKPIVIVQARLSSTRLPAKTMLKIGNYSVISLIALRLKSLSYQLAFAFPSGSEGDILKNEIDELNDPSIKVIFGSLNNVLERFNDACQELNDDSTIIRMTADNLIPDRYFVEELIENYEGGYSYSKINDSAYGLSAEIFKKYHLTEAIINAKKDFDLEHVTPYIKEKYSKNPINHNFKCKHNLRLTLDTYEDFRKLSYLFKKFNNKVNVSWHDLLNKAYEIFPEEKKLMIGCAQFGMNYGIANKTGKIKDEEVTNIIQYANINGVTNYDTAADYGKSEKVLGKNKTYLSNSRIFTKLRKDVKTFDEVKSSILQSCHNTKREKMDAVLLHKFDHLGSKVWDYLKICREEGLVQNIGVSVYEPKEAFEILNDGSADIIQIPFNILDTRWSSFLKKGNKKIIICARSIFLQGAAINPKVLNKMGYFKIAQSLIECVKNYNRKNLVDLCIAFVRSQQAINYIIMGVDNSNQMKENIYFFKNKTLAPNEIQEVNDIFKDMPISLIDPRLWD